MANERRIGRDFYESDYYSGPTHLTDFSSRFQRYRIKHILDIYYPLPHERALDLGCGWGTLSIALSPLCKEVVGLDFSPRSIEFSTQAAEDRKIGNVNFLCADAKASGLEAASFDLIVAADLLEHLYPDDSEKVIEEAFRLLRPGGHFVVWTPHRGHVFEILKNNNILLKRDPSHVDYKSMDRCTRLLITAGFIIKKAFYAPSHVPLLSSLEKLLQGLCPLFRRRICVLASKGPVG